MEGKMKSAGQLITVEKKQYVDRQGIPCIKFKVNPPVTRLKRGEKLTVVFDGPKSGVVMVPVSGVFAEQVNPVPRSKRPHVDLEVLPKAPLGAFSFAVICNDGRKDHYGKGTTPPKIIIVDPKGGNND